MRCSSYCTAESYKVADIVEALIENGQEPKYFDDVVYVHSAHLDGGDGIDIFYFPFGCLTIWNASDEEEQGILKQLQDIEEGHMDEPSSDVIYFQIDEKLENAVIEEETNTITLAENSVFTKLSISYALSQSVKLDVLEKSVANIIIQSAPLKDQLAAKGRVSLSRKAIARKIGMLFNERYSVNLHSDILDTPEFLWRQPNFEPLYLRVAAFQDIQTRQAILNRRLDMIHELYSLLSNELEVRHSSRLEWIIIGLITIEVVLSLFENGGLYKLFLWLSSL